MSNLHISKIELIQKQIDEEIRRRQKLKQNILILISLPRLRNIKDRLNKIKQLLSIEKYDLVFIGQAGVGKTTAICHCFNLIHEENREIKKNTQSNFIKELLPTASGKTTLCEVIIKPALNTFIKIEPYSNDEIKQFLEYFCNYIWFQVYPDNNEESEVSEIPHTELRRVIRNLVDLQETKVNGELIDKGIEYAKNFSDKQYQKFKDSVTKRANLDKRERKIIQYTADISSEQPNIEEKLWIKTNFNDLNLGKLKYFSIPKQIIIGVTNSIIDFQQYPRFNSIVDTRGMDIIEDRPDLEHYLRNPKTVCIFTDNFSSAPKKDLCDLISRYLTAESRDINTKFALVVLPRKGEPEELMGADGKVNDREEGIEIRKRDIMASFQKRNIRFIPDNIIFYDARRCYLHDGRIDFDYKDEVGIDKEIFINQINSIIDNLRETLIKEVQDLNIFFQNIKKGNQLETEDERLLENLKKKIEDECSLNDINYNFTERYILKLKSEHISVFRAINRRFGTYDYRSKDIYFDGKNIVKDVVRESLKNPKSKILGAIDLAEKEAHDQATLEPIMKILKRQVNDNYEAIVGQISEDIRTILKDEKLYPQKLYNEFWQDIENRWGKGHGYRDYVLNMYEEKIKDIDELLKQKIKELWESNINEIIGNFSAK
jgi:GTPase SAR1 family protein